MSYLYHVWSCDSCHEVFTKYANTINGVFPFIKNEKTGDTFCQSCFNKLGIEGIRNWGKEE